MSNRLTTWELKAVDNLPEVIKRMEQIASLLQQQQQLSASSSSAITKQLSDITSGYNSLVKSMDAVLKEQQANTQAAKDAATASQAAVSASVRASSELRAAKEAERKQLQEIKAQYDAMKSSVTTLGTLIGITFSASQIRQFLVDVIDANTRINLFSKSLEIMLQNKKQADEIAAYALNLSTRSTLDVKQIIEVTQRLVAMGAESGKVNTYLEMLGELSSVVGTHKLPLIAKALLDVQNKQKLYAQEVRQFTDNGIPLFQLLAESMDLPIKKVKQLADDHKITFEDVEKALLKATQEGGKYYGMMALQAESLGGSLKNLSDRVFLAMARFGEFVKDGLGAAIKAAGNFIESMTGTNAQMQRTIDIVKSVTSAIVAFTVSSRAAAVVVAAKELVMRAYTIAVGTTRLAMQGLTAAIGANMTITTAAANTARAFWATLASNPIGLVIAAVGLATSAYFAYRAATSEANEATHVLNNRIAEAQAPLELTRTEFNRLAKEVLSSKASVEEKTKALEKLKDKYPQQMKGIEDLADAEKKLGALMKEVNNDFLIRIKLLENEVRTAVNNEAAKAAIREKIKLEGELATASTERAKIYGTAGKMEVYSDAEVLKSRIDKLNTTIVQAQKFNDNIAFQSARLAKMTNDAWDTVDEQIEKEETRWKKVSASMDKGSKEYQKALKEHNAILAKLRGDDFTNHNNNEEGKKNKAVLTAKEIAVLTKETQQDSFKDQINLIDAQMKLDIERANHAKKSKAEVEKDIIRIVEAAEAEKAALRKKYSDMMLASTKETDSEAAISSKELAEVLKFDMKEVEKEKKKTEAEKRKENRQTHQEWEQYQRDVQRLTKETAEVEQKARRESLQLLMSYIGSFGDGYADIARIGKKVIDDIDLISGKSRAAAAEQVMHNQKLAEDAARIFGAGTEQYNQARLRVGESQKTLAEVNAAASQATMGIAMMVFDTLKNIGNAINQSIVETNDAIIKSYETVKKANTDFYNAIIRNAEEAFKVELEMFTGTYEEKNRIIDEHYAKQKEYAEARDVINFEAARAQKMLEIDSSMRGSLVESSKNMMGKMIAGMYEMQAFEEQIRQQKLQREAENAAQIRDAKIKAIQDELSEFKKAAQERIDAENELLQYQLERNEQLYSDKKIRMEFDDKYRSQLLADGEAREVAALEAAMQRELDRVHRIGGTEDEIARIKESFAAAIAATHKKYEEAKGDKEKEISLANIEIKAKEVDEKNRLEKENKDKTDAIKNEMLVKENQTKDAMIFENQKYRDFVIQANKDMLESQKQMAIAQLQAEIAILRGKKNIFNSGRINAAIGDLEQAIRDLEGVGAGAENLGEFVAETAKKIAIAQRKADKTPFNADTMQVVTEAYDRDGNAIQLTYTDEDRTFVAYDKNKNAFKVRNATGFVEKTGEKFYKGTPYVEGLSYPDGIDTVPAMINKGERILPDWMNERIGGKQLSNEALEQKVLFADSILNRVASIRQTLTFDKFFNPFPMMPISSTPQADLDALADKIAAAVNANSTSINVTPFGMSVKEKSRMSQNITYYENTVYSKRQ